MDKVSPMRFLSASILVFDSEQAVTHFTLPVFNFSNENLPEVFYSAPLLVATYRQTMYHNLSMLYVFSKI